MAPVGGRRFLEYSLYWLQKAGIRDLVMCVGYKWEQIRDWLGDGRQRGFRIRYSIETRPLGTGGALKLAAGMVASETCFVLNGDSFLELDLGGMYRFHQSKRALATIALARVQDPARYGAIHLDRNGKIVVFHEKSTPPIEHPHRCSGGSLINCGIYIFQRRFLDAIPAGGPVSLEKQIFPGLAGSRFYGFVTDGFFIDIGTPEDYLKSQTELEGRLF
jgi:NDP-sugar pyrophosphorylase family protein